MWFMVPSLIIFSVHENQLNQKRQAEYMKFDTWRNFFQAPIIASGFFFGKVTAECLTQTCPQIANFKCLKGLHTSPSLFYPKTPPPPCFKQLDNVHLRISHIPSFCLLTLKVIVFVFFSSIWTPIASLNLKIVSHLVLKIFQEPRIKYSAICIIIVFAWW